MILTNAYAEKDKKGIEDRFFLHKVAVEQRQPRDGQQHHEAVYTSLQTVSSVLRIIGTIYYSLLSYFLLMI